MLRGVDDVLGRDAPAPGHRDEPDREPAGDLPRRADDRARSAGAHRGVAGGEGARRRRYDGAAHDAVSGGGRTARRSDRDPPPGPDHPVNGTLAELRQLLPPTTVEYVEKQPTLQDVFLSLGRRRRVTNHDDRALPCRHDRLDRTVPAPHHAQLRHHHHDRRHADRHHAAVRVRVRRRDRHRVGLLRGLHAARHPADHDRVGHRLHRGPAVHGHAERALRALPVDADRAFGRAVGTRADLAGRQSDLGRGRRARRPGSSGFAPGPASRRGSRSPAS